MLTDLEPGAHLTAKETYPQMTSCGRYFHLGQSVARNVAGLDVRNKYSGGGDSDPRVQSLPAIAPLKVAGAIPAFVQLAMLFQENEIQPAPPFERPCVGAIPAGGNGRMAPLFPIAFRGVHARCDSGFLRTDNAAEGFRQGSAKSMARADHPDMWRFLTALERKQAITRLDMASVLLGNEKKPICSKRGRNGGIACYYMLTQRRF